MEALVSDEKAVHLLEQCFAYAAANERELIRLNAAAQGQSLPNKSKPPPDLPPKSPKLSPVADIEEAPKQRDGVKVDMTYSEQIRIYKTVALERKLRDDKAERIRLLRVHQTRFPGHTIDDGSSESSEGWER